MDIAREALAKINWRGPALPIVRRQGGYFSSRNVYDLIRSSIYMILTTRIGSRVMRPEFGSNLPSLVFEQNDAVLSAQVRFYTVDAINRWEPRVRIMDVGAIINGHVFVVRLSYMILATLEQRVDDFEFSRELAFGGVF